VPLVAPKRHLSGEKLGGNESKLYIGPMRPDSMFIRWSPLVAGWALAWPNAATAQTFSADYALARSGIETSPGPHQLGLISFGRVRLGPALHSDGNFAGGGLSVAAGQNWFGEVAIGRSLQSGPDDIAGQAAAHIGGGYRWSDGRALSLQLTGRRGGSRLGLSVNYDWPRYFVRLSYDPGLKPLPQDNLRFSAGMRF
jgi:hypothetical protein